MSASYGKSDLGMTGENAAYMQHLLSILYFLLAGLCEIDGGYLVWLWLREGKSLWYGVILTLQPAHFGRVDAAYGGVFVVLSV